jgi:hypothetical protein
MRQVILYCPTDDCDCCPALFLSGSSERPFAITDKTDPRGTVFLTRAELDSLGTDAPLITVTSENDEITLIGSDDSRISMTTAYYQGLVGSIRDGSTWEAVKAATV